MRISLAVVLAVLATAPAAGASRRTVDIGMGAGASVAGLGAAATESSGRLDQRGLAGRLRVRWREGALALEPSLALGDLHRSDVTQPYLAWLPGISAVAVRTWSGVDVHARLGVVGGILLAPSGVPRPWIPCEPGEECIEKRAEPLAHQPAWGVEAGVGAQLHLGGGTLHPILWVDISARLLSILAPDGPGVALETPVTAGIAAGWRY